MDGWRWIRTGGRIGGQNLQKGKRSYFRRTCISYRRRMEAKWLEKIYNRYDLETLYLERRSKSEKGDSGWYIDSVEDSIVEKEYEVYYTYEILKIRLEIMKILVLSIGYLVVLEKDKLKAILNDKDINLLEEFVLYFS